MGTAFSSRSNTLVVRQHRGQPGGGGVLLHYRSRPTSGAFHRGKPGSSEAPSILGSGPILQP